jgi:hypothetical protein
VKEASRWDTGKQESFTSDMILPPVYSKSHAEVVFSAIHGVARLTATIGDNVESRTSLVDHLIGKTDKHIALDVPECLSDIPRKS